MRIVMFAAGTQGDVRPHVALGVGLARRGHDVVLVSSANFEELVRGHGLGFAPITADFQAMMQADQAKFDGKPQVIVALHGLRQLRRMAAQWSAEALPAGRGADLIIGSGAALYLAASVAEALQVPFVRTMLQPIEPAREITPLLFGASRRRLPGRLNLLLHAVTRNATWQLGRPAMSRVRRDLGLRPYPLRGPWRLRHAGRAPLLNGFSPLLVPESVDWGPDVATTGSWELRTPADYVPDRRILDFLETGPKPVYVGFGSMVSHDGASLARVVHAAIRRSGLRAIIAGGWGGLAVPDERGILCVGDVPHDWLLPRVLLAVHHCGAGTAAAALRAGIPSVPVPFLLDQFFWAERLARIGTATRPMRRKTMTGEELAAAIGEAASASMIAHAASVGARLRLEDGVGAAIAQLEAWGRLPAGSGFVPAAAAAT